jgi:hypothetical protein
LLLLGKPRTVKRVSDHLKKSNTTYIAHLTWAVYAGFVLIGTGFASIIHGLFPFLFDGTAAKTIINMFYRRLYNHPNPDYQYKIMKEMKKAKS